MRRRERDHLDLLVGAEDEGPSGHAVGDGIHREAGAGATCRATSKDGHGPSGPPIG